MRSQNWFTEVSQNCMECLGLHRDKRQSICILLNSISWVIKNLQVGKSRRVRQTSWCSANPKQVEAIVHPMCSPLCCNSFFLQTLWSREADFIGLACLVLWITNQLRVAIPTSTRGVHAEKTKPRICSNKSFPAQQVLAIPKRKPKNSS